LFVLRGKDGVLRPAARSRTYPLPDAAYRTVQLLRLELRCLVGYIR
jgi:hypothetical protein